ncbi:hypothetical protein, partial [Pseudoalteromonas sp. GAB2316C]|uniref:hypothetical protein n=1 Tax=Pseudoalteromonas sp. GAB2316C TaxID=3025326 RepID=UPI0023592BC1
MPVDTSIPLLNTPALQRKLKGNRGKNDRFPEPQELRVPGVLRGSRVWDARLLAEFDAVIGLHCQDDNTERALVAVTVNPSLSVR